MALGLHVGTHHAITHHRLAVAGQEGRDDGVERAFARCHQVGGVTTRGCAQVETVTPVLQADAERRLDRAGAKTHVIALDEADHHAALVGGRQVDRAALGRVAGAKILRARHVDQRGALPQVGGVKHLLGGHLHGAGLGHVAVGVGKRQLHGLDLQMLRGHAVDLHRCQIEVRQDAQRDQCGNTLAVGWNFVQGVPAVVPADGLDPFGSVAGQIVLGECTAVFGREARQRLRDRAAVEGLAAAVGDRPQTAGRRGKTEQLAHFGRTAPGQEGFGKAGHGLQFGRGGSPLLLHHHRDRVAALGQFDGRLHQIGEGQLAKALAQGDPAGHGAGHSY